MFQRKLQGIRFDTVVFDGVSRPDDLHILQADDGFIKSLLDIRRQTGGHPLYIYFIRVQSFRFQERLVPFLIGEPDHLVLDGRAIPGADPHDLPTV